MCIRPICAFGLATALVCGRDQFASAQCGHLGWSALGDGIGGQPGSRVLSLAEFNDGLGGGPTIYAGGELQTAGTVTAPNIARWDGATWHAVGEGVNGAVRAMAVFDDGLGGGPALYVGGDFTTAGTIAAQRIARWDGVEWSSIGDIPSGSVHAMKVFNDGTGDALYVAGTFEEAGEFAARNIARWDGTVWTSLGPGLGEVGESVNCLESFDDDRQNLLYAGGTFSFAPSPRIAAWNGLAWTGLGGADAPVTALAALDGGILQGLYVGGSFTSIGGADIIGLARWTGTQWLSMSLGFVEVLALEALDHVSAPKLFVGKNGTYGKGGQSSFYAWDGNARTSGVLLGGTVQSLLAINGGDSSALHVGGRLNFVGFDLVQNIARFYTIEPHVDCNQNRIDDSCDLAAGTVPDCNADHVPDECQATHTYQMNDGPPGLLYGLAGGGDYLWLNQFTVQPRSQFIDHVVLPWSPSAETGLVVQVAIYRDPNNDGDPNDAVLARLAAGENYFEDWPLRLAKVRVPLTYVGAVGNSFFVAGFTRSQDFQAAAVAGLSEPLNMRSWRKGGAFGSIDLHHPSSGGAILLVPERNWILRAISKDCNRNGVWDDCDISSGTSMDVNVNGVPDECEGTCAEDVPYLQGDGVVNLDDLLFLIDEWGRCTDGSCAADITNDSTVNIDDLLAVINAWGPCE